MKRLIYCNVLIKFSMTHSFKAHTIFVHAKTEWKCFKTHSLFLVIVYLDESIHSFCLVV